MVLKNEAKLTITEGMTVKYIKQHGSSAQKLIANLFDTDDSGDFKGNEVKLFNNCDFSLKSDELVINDKELQAKGYGGVITMYIDKGSNSIPGIKDGVKFKYGIDEKGYRHIGRTDDYNINHVITEGPVVLFSEPERHDCFPCYHHSYIGFDNVDCGYAYGDFKITNGEKPQPPIYERWYNKIFAARK